MAEKQEKEKRNYSPSGGNSRFERGRKTKVKRHKASNCSFGGPVIKGIDTIYLLTKQLWWFKTLLPRGYLLPSSVEGYPDQLLPAEQSRENSNGHPSPLWPSGTLGLTAHGDKLKLSCLTSH